MRVMKLYGSSPGAEFGFELCGEDEGAECCACIFATASGEYHFSERDCAARERALDARLEAKALVKTFVSQRLSAAPPKSAPLRTRRLSHACDSRFKMSCFAAIESLSSEIHGFVTVL
jgi:hypothetical protein